MFFKNIYGILSQTSTVITGSTFYTDDFESYTTGELGGQGNWINCMGGINVQDISGDNRVTYYNYGVQEVVKRSETYNANQYSQVTLEVALGGTYLGPCLRTLSTGETTECYAFIASSDGDAYLIYMYGSAFDIIATASTAVTNNDVLKITVNNNVIKGYINDVEVISATDSSISSGVPGIAGSYGYFGRIDYVDNWEGGNL
jgi:hypothetical protein